MFTADQVNASKIRNLTNAGMFTAVAVFAVMLFYCCVVQPLQSTDFIYYSDQNGFHMSDFVLFVASGRMCLSGDRLHAYDPDVQLRYINELIAPMSLPKDFFLQQAPFMFAVMVPLALVPVRVAYVGWVSLLTALACGSLLFYLTRCKGWTLLKAASCTAFVFCAFPAASAWKLGQPVWLVLCFYLLYLFAYEKQRPLLAGLAIAACSFKPQYGIILGLHALGTRRWKTVMWAAVGTALLLAAGILTVGWDNVVHYPRILHEAETSSNYSGVCPEYMISIRAWLARYMTPVQALDVSSALWAAAAVVDCMLFALTYRRGVACRCWAFAVAIGLSLVFSPHTHVHDTLLLAAAFAVTRATKDEPVPSGVALILDRVWLVMLLLYVPLSWPMHSFDMIARFQKIPFLIADSLLLLVIAANLAVRWHGDTKYDAEGEVLQMDSTT